MLFNDRNSETLNDKKKIEMLNRLKKKIVLPTEKRKNFVRD